MKAMKEIIKIKEDKEDELLAIPGITGVDVGKKITKGVKTDEVAIRVYVKKKKDKVPEKELIPKKINGVVTDVIECEFKLHTAGVALADIERRADTATYSTLVGGISGNFDSHGKAGRGHPRHLPAGSNRQQERVFRLRRQA